MFAAFNYTPQSVAALGEPFMSMRIVGEVVNQEVSEAMARTLGVAPPQAGTAAGLAPAAAPVPMPSGSFVVGAAVAAGVVFVGMQARWYVLRRASRRAAFVQRRLKAGEA